MVIEKSGLVWVVVGLIGLFSVPNLSWASELNDAPQRCRQLAEVDFSTLADAPTQVMSAMFVNEAKDSPSHCDVQGYVSPAVGVQILLPAERWNGKLLELGCGGFCGGNPVSYGGCNDALRKGYACVASDQGHRSTGIDAKWAYNNLQAEIDYGYRSAHLAVVVGRAIAAQYYSSAPTRSYFMGCSGGGRQALVEAQRFPFDFDGIVATEPALNLSSIFMSILWSTRLVGAEEASPVFADRDLELLHNAVVAKCDLNDGVKDGLIGDPRVCRFAPAELACKGESHSACLSAGQIAAAQKVYAGPMNSAGERLTAGGSMLGSEIGGRFGMSAYQAGKKEPGFSSFSTEFFRYMGFVPDPGPGWTARDFDFDRDYKRLGMMESIYASIDPDLRRFKGRGGKLILTQGLHDDGLPFAYNSIDYYETATKTMGGAAATQDFFRLFLVPGRGHCGGGEGAWAIDHLSYLDAWVEQGKAPDQMLGVHPRKADFLINFPLLKENTQFSRPVYPYPAVAHYKGRGDPTAVENFEPRDPRK